MKILINMMIILLFMCISWSAGIAADCTGVWNTIQNYNRANGTPCEILGLDTHQGTCLPGQNFEILCDDASGGRYRTCQGQKSCHNAADCSGSWNTIPNYNRAFGTPCEILGLDTHQGTCLPDQKFEILCDDASGGRYRTCQGPSPCRMQRSSNSDCGDWDFAYDQPCPPGFFNSDCRGPCEEIYTTPPCESWDFSYNRPCPDGFVNLDCSGICEPANRYRR